MGSGSSREIELPHNYEEILRDADDWVDRSSKEKLFKQLCAGVFLNQKKQKYWVDKRQIKNCFTLFANDLSIAWGDGGNYDEWPWLENSSSVRSSEPRWLQIQGRFDVSKLSPATTYEVIFVVMMKDSYGKNIPVDVRLILPDASRQEHKENLGEKPVLKWIEIHAGEFTTLPMVNNVEIEFTIYQFEGGLRTQKHLIISNAVIRAKG